jgi:hypothetical protein
MRQEIEKTLSDLRNRSIPGGGFSEYPDSGYRPDSTAWAILALKGSVSALDIVESARSRLASEQFDDGRVCLSQHHPEAMWPTALAILAWKGSVVYRKNQEHAIQFLLKTKGKSSKKRADLITTVDSSADLITTVDSSLVGWPWIEETFSWVEPTAFSILALNVSGFCTHERVHEAVRLLMDRQLPSGGWNIGSTIIYGRETYPQPDCTGIALAALKGFVEKEEIDHSLYYLKRQVASCRSPLSLGWALFGLGAWGERPSEAKRLLADCLSRQKKYGAYGTTLLSLILLAYRDKNDFLESIA